MNMFAPQYYSDTQTRGVETEDIWTAGTGEEWKVQQDDENSYEEISPIPESENEANLSLPESGHLADFLNQLRLRLKHLELLFRETNNQNWGGEDEAPVASKAYRKACILLLMTMKFPAPRVGVSPKGCLLLEWKNSAADSFIISLNRTPVMTYSGLFPEAIAPGTVDMEGLSAGLIFGELEKLHRH